MPKDFNINTASREELEDMLQYYYRILMVYMESTGDHQEDIDYISDMLHKIDVEICKRDNSY